MTSEIAPGLYELTQVGRSVNAFVWHPRPSQRTAAGAMLFDCGWPWSGHGLVANLIALGCQPEELRGIAITHDDIDHTGRLAALHAISAAHVFAHHAEALRLARDTWREPPDHGRIVDMMVRLMGRFYVRWPHHSVRVTHALNDGDILPDGWIAVHTPGHTPGHTSYFHPELRVLIAGDALGHWDNGRLRFPMLIYTEDPAEAACSIRKLAALEPDIICFGHGPVLKDAAEPLQEFAAQLPGCPQRAGSKAHAGN